MTIIRFCLAVCFLSLPLQTYGQPPYPVLASDYSPNYDMEIPVQLDASRVEVKSTMGRPSGEIRESFRLARSELIRDFQMHVLKPASNAEAVIMEKENDHRANALNGETVRWRGGFRPGDVRVRRDPAHCGDATYLLPTHPPSDKDRCAESIRCE
jgi:hypothetical protein